MKESIGNDILAHRRHRTISCLPVHKNVLLFADIQETSRMYLSVSLAALLLCPMGQAADVLMWSSVGAGYRGFPFLVGVGNIFGQAGLLNETSSKFQNRPFA